MISNKKAICLKFSALSLVISAAVLIASILPAIASSSHLIYVINIDVMPPFTEQASKLLEQYREDALKEKGVKRIEVLQRLEHGNHFALIEEWLTQADYDAHCSTKETRDFRTKLQPMLGSPFDERVHHPLN